MRHALIVAVLALVLAGTLGNVACGHGLPPLYVPTSPAGVSTAGVPFSAQQVEEATAQGAIFRGWAIIHRAPGLVIADMNSGGQGARVRILSDASGWRIEHEQSSPGLRWTQDPERGQVIHKRYNQWVKSLDDSIRRALFVPVSAGGYYAPGPAPAPQDPAAPAPQGAPAPQDPQAPAPAP